MRDIGVTGVQTCALPISVSSKSIPPFNRGRSLPSPMNDEIAFLSARELLGRYARGDLSPVEVAEAANARAGALGPVLNALTTATPELAVEQARESERRWGAGDRRPLEGGQIGRASGRGRV